MDKEIDLKDLKLLIIDDDPAYLDFMSIKVNEIFKSEYVSLAIDTFTAKEKIKQNNYDIILCDYKLRETDGITFAKELRLLEPKAIIIIKTAAEFEETTKLFLEGIKNGIINGFIYLPQDINDLKNLIKDIVYKTDKS